MSNEDLNVLLYHKMFAEQKNYQRWLLQQPPSTILEHAYRYAMQEDILLCFEYNDLPDHLAKALLGLGRPLEKVFRKWEAAGYNHMEEMWNISQGFAEETHRRFLNAKSKGR